MLNVWYESTHDTDAYEYVVKPKFNYVSDFNDSFAKIKIEKK